ncbi:hypothetical protein G6F16_002584 [Rhizopus arrhizus]|nr:hypothetical protein G6F21_001377 [Rhizopus arrhizus]KAG0802299.1 hypothetical protein G6F22_000395 [Rhizopus arrhizus]KAG0817793.1 hypothetical protein G6F20_002091 [Rhizopus arrhizus]KAG0840469.1 hypothetical protein G6F19_002034 [Rhizopus arrhizus]KAG0844254.1 hypothetical protein G6F18_002047 [Rhizopus arrhizus]
MDIISYLLYEQDELIHSQLFDAFLNNHLLQKEDKDQYVVNMQQTIHGIFVPLANCYSPSCRSNNLNCYSPLCPNKVFSDLLQLIDQEHVQQKDWIQNIPQHLIDLTSQKELKRQAAIAELVATEKNYIQDLLILHNAYALPLLESPDIITDSSRRQQFYQTVFSNHLEIIQLHHSFYHALKAKKRQSSPLIGRVGTLLMHHVNELTEPYILYTSQHTKSLHAISLELQKNLTLTQFLADQDAQKFTRRLGLRHYLTAPTLWIGRFKLMVEAILKHTEDDGDQLAIKVAITLLHDTLCRMNSEMKQDDLYRSEVFAPRLYQGSELLRLPTEARLLFKEDVRLARPDHPLQPLLCRLFLFSHALILTCPKTIQGKREYDVIKGTPIPIQMVWIHQEASLSFKRQLSLFNTHLNRHASSIRQGLPSEHKTWIHQQIKTRLLSLKSLYFPSSAPVVPMTEKNVSVVRRESAPASLLSKKKTSREHSIGLSIKKRSLRITHLACPQHTFRLEFFSRSQKANWENRIRQAAMDSMRHEPLKPSVLPTDHRMPVDQIQCACVFNYMNQSFIGLGSLSGVWILPSKGEGQVKWVIRGQKVNSLSVLDDKVIVLSANALLSYPLQEWMNDCKASTLSAHAFKSSRVMCSQTGTLRSQPVVAYITKKSQQKDSTLTTLTLTPSSGHWLKKYKKANMIFLSSPSEGIQRADGTVIVDGPHTGFTIHEQRMFVYHGHQVQIIDLLNHTPSRKIQFESTVHQLAIHPPYLIAFSSLLIEIKHIETGQLMQAIVGQHIDCIHTSQPILFTMSTATNPIICLYQL